MSSTSSTTTARTGVGVFGFMAGVLWATLRVDTATTAAAVFGA